MHVDAKLRPIVIVTRLIYEIDLNVNSVDARQSW